MAGGDPQVEVVSDGGDQGIVVASHVYPERLPIIALPNRPLFPRMVAPVLLESPGVVQAVNDAIQSESRLVGLVLARAENDQPSPAAARLHRVGVIAQVLKLEQHDQTGQLHALFGALDRFELVRVLSSDPYLVAAVRYRYEKPGPVDDELKAYALAVINYIKELIQQNPLYKEELALLSAQGSLEEPSRLADYAAYLTSASGEDLQRVLEAEDVRERLELSLTLLERELDISKLQARIRRQIEERVTKQQREFFLREQLKIIKQELGLEKDDKQAEIDRFRQRLAALAPSDEAKARIDEELSKLALLEPTSPEFGVTRNYLDWLTSLPWGVRRGDDTSIARARQVLDQHHAGLRDVKERILEFVAVGLLKGSFAGSIICLVGPPGVGKTSVGRSIARSLDREFFRFSVGGMQDEAEIKGHRRTYVGAMPGKFIQALRVTGTENPVILLDEIDKIGTSYRGDPASALLEALDPAQNREFLDHYLDVRFDLSNVLFVCTANQLDTIPAPLLDRMEVIKLSGYILEEKLEIARRHLIPTELAAHGLKKSQLAISVAALREIIDGYSREPGVRSLEQQLKKIIRKSARRLLERRQRRITVDVSDIEPLLGKRLYLEELLHEQPLPGVVMGLAWTSHGGDTLFVEATGVRTGQAGLKQTGQLGKVMIESSEIAYTYVRHLAASDPGCKRYFEEHLVHLHVPAGATPKDGPSAGITMASALYTLARRKPIKKSFAMTGELTLSGRVMPVGGIKEKIIAAKRAKLKHVVLPSLNRADFVKLPPHVRRGLRAHYVDTFEDVVRLCLT